MVRAFWLYPFKLSAKLKESRTTAPAKGGETASHNIEVKAGETPFKPGPVVGELQKAEIPAAIQDGKVVVKNDKEFYYGELWDLVKNEINEEKAKEIFEL